MDNLSEVFSYRKSNIILGDFNIDLLKDTCYSKQLKRKIDDWGMKQLITKPTRITENSKTLIDLVITNNCNLKADSVIDNSVSDHNNIEIYLNDRSDNDTIDKFKVLKYNSDELRLFLNEINWKQKSDQNLEEKTNYFCDNIKKCVVNFTKECSVNNKLQNKWYTKELAELKDDLIVLHRKAVYINEKQDWSNYRKARNSYSKKFLATDNEYVRSSIQDKYGDQKGMWKILKKLVKSKGQSKFECIRI